MKVLHNKDNNTFVFAELSFKELKVIKDAIQALGKSGSAAAAQVAQIIEKAMENIAI